MFRFLTMKCRRFDEVSFRLPARRCRPLLWKLALCAIALVGPARAAARPSTDSGPATLATIEITAPAPGQLFVAGETVTITATAIDPTGYIARVEFYDSETQIGVSQLAFFRAPDPGTPIYHSLAWLGAASGDHLLTARAVDTQGNPVVSNPVKVTVGKDASLPVVHITAIDPEAIELPPLVEVIDPARFSISREGDLSQELSVIFSLHGTAEPGLDYARPDSFVRIPAGESEVTLTIAPLPDNLIEKMETVAIRLQDPKPVSAVPAAPRLYSISDSNAAAVAVIYDQRRPEHGALELGLPTEGEAYSAWQPVPIYAALSLPTPAPSHVDYYANEKLIGSSDLASSPGLAAHHFDWKGAGAGEQVITARARLADGTELVSSQVHITLVGSDPTPPVLTLVSPQSGAVFSLGDSVAISAVVQDATVSIKSLDLLDGGQVLQSTTNREISVRRTDLVAGTHGLVARLVQSDGTEILSSPVRILVWAAGGANTGTAGPAQLSNIARQPNGHVSLSLAGPLNGLGLVEVSTDLVHWSAGPPVFLPDGKIVIEEDATAGPRQRFYRTRSP
jgi:hypothetical protein